MTRSVQCFITFCVLLFEISPLAQAQIVSELPDANSSLQISDRLVENLACENMNFNAFKKSIRRDFTSSTYHLPLRNYAIPFLGSEIANCWSLSRLQRLFFYLGTDEINAKPSPIEFLNMVRGSEPYLTEGQIREWPQISYSRFWWPIENQQKNMLMQNWMKTIFQDIGDSHILKRDLKRDLESFQRRRFSDFIRNAKYIIRSGPRSPRINRRTVEQLKHILDRNEVPLVIIRENRMAQHVVALKAYRTIENAKNSSTFAFTVYDSNSPWTDNEFIFSTTTDHFYAPRIMTGLTGVKNPNSAMGVFLVDENERGYVLNSLFKSYQNKCAGLKTTAIN